MADKSNSKKESTVGVSITFLVICGLLILWRGPGFVEDIRLFANGETTVATIERKFNRKQRRDNQRARYVYYFLADNDTIRGESRMFEPLMAMTSKDDGMGGDRTFKVIHDPSDSEVFYPRATLRVHFLFSLFVLLIATRFGYMGVMEVLGKGPKK